MSFLMVEQLQNGEQFNIDINLKGSIQIDAIRLGLYKKGTFTGNLNIKVFNYDGQLLATGLLDTTKLNALSTYYHGMFDIQLNKSIEINTTTNNSMVRVQVEVSGYTNSDINYLALIREPNPSVPVNQSYLYPTNDPEKDIWLSPWKVELFSYKIG